MFGQSSMNSKISNVGTYLGALSKSVLCLRKYWNISMRGGDSVRVARASMRPMRDIRERGGMSNCNDDCSISFNRRIGVSRATTSVPGTNTGYTGLSIIIYTSRLASPYGCLHTRVSYRRGSLEPATDPAERAARVSRERGMKY